VVRRAWRAQGGADTLHLDMFDGVEIDSPNALTFGPQMVRPSPPLCRRFSRVT
jgi:hypothetical protein